MGCEAAKRNRRWGELGVGGECCQDGLELFGGDTFVEGDDDLVGALQAEVEAKVAGALDDGGGIAGFDGEGVEEGVAGEIEAGGLDGIGETCSRLMNVAGDGFEAFRTVID